MGEQPLWTSNTYTNQNMGSKPNHASGPSTLMRFLGCQWYRECKDIPSNVKDRLLHLAFPTTKKAQCFVDIFGFWRKHIPHLDVLLWPIIKYFRKLIALNGAWNQRSLLNRSRLLCMLLYYLNHMAQQTRWYLSHQRQVGILFGALGRSLLVSHRRNLRDFEARLYCHLQTNFLLLRGSF